MKLKNKIILDKNKYYRYFKIGSYWFLLYLFYIFFFDYLSKLEIFTLEKSISYFVTFSLYILIMAIPIYGFYLIFSSILDKSIIRKDWINLFKISIPINKEVLNEIDSKFKRKQINIEGSKKKEKEWHYEFSKRIIYSILKKQLKKLN